MCDFSGIPVLMINPQLINMDQGYGVRKKLLFGLFFYLNSDLFSPNCRSEKYSKKFDRYFYNGLQIEDAEDRCCCERVSLSVFCVE